MSMYSSQRPLLSSYQRRVSRRERLLQLAPWLGVFLVGFLLAWFIKPSGPDPEDLPGKCALVSVVPGDVLPAPRDITVNVYNATKRVGLASITSVDLHTRGFKVGIVGSSDATVRGIGVIRYVAGSRGAADRLAAYVPGALFREITREDAQDVSVDLVVGDAFTAVAPDVQAKAVLSVPLTKPSGLGCPVLE